MNYFKDDEKTIIRSELLDEKAKEIAESFVQYRYNNRKQQQEVDPKRSLSSAQLRKFFNEFRQLEKKVDHQGFEKILPLIKMVKSKASYAANPNNPKIIPQFRDFLINNTDEIKDSMDFKAFILHFEAVVGFFYGTGISNN